jgi:hypothetical protein
VSHDMKMAIARLSPVARQIRKSRHTSRRRRPDTQGASAGTRKLGVSLSGSTPRSQTLSSPETLAPSSRSALRRCLEMRGWRRRVLVVEDVPEGATSGRAPQSRRFDGAGSWEAS